MSWFSRTNVIAARQRQEVAKADNAGFIGHKGTPLPANERGKPCGAAAFSAPAKDEQDAVTKASTDLDKALATFGALIAEHEATMKKMNRQDDTAADPTADTVQGAKPRQPGTSNLVHTPHPEGVYAKQDRRTVHSVHNVNRQVRGVPSSPVTKSAHVQGGGSVRLVNGAGLDLSSMFEGVHFQPV